MDTLSVGLSMLTRLTRKFKLKRLLSLVIFSKSYCRSKSYFFQAEFLQSYFTSVSRWSTKRSLVGLSLFLNFARRLNRRLTSVRIVHTVSIGYDRSNSIGLRGRSPNVDGGGVDATTFRAGRRWPQSNWSLQADVDRSSLRRVDLDRCLTLVRGRPRPPMNA